MPTGYTSAIDENPGIPFRSFALRCARAFGALVTMRDDPLDAPLPEKFEPAPYYRDRLTKANADLSEALGMTVAEARVLMESEAEARAKRNAKRREEHAATAAAYMRMRGEVLAWKPPTSEHEGIKKFMLEQLSTGDPGSLYQEDEGASNAAEWLARRIASCSREVERAAKAMAEEEQRCRTRTDWLQALVASLPEAKSP